MALRQARKIRDSAQEWAIWLVVQLSSLLASRRGLLGRRLADETGATTLEYGLLVLMAVVVLGAAIQTLGGGISTFFTKLTKSVTSLN